MDQITRKRIEGTLCCLGMLFAGLFSSAGVCHASLANLRGLTVNITTVDVPGGWTNKSSGTNAEFVCNATDNGSSASGTRSGTDKPCDSGNHTSYVRTDDKYKGVESDGWIKPVDRNFTIHVSAPSAAKTRIEWTSKAAKYDLPNTDDEWKTGLVHGSYTCDGQSCDVCVVGGKCAHPVLPASALSVQSNGNQSTLFIRINACDGNDYVKTGWDAVKDKYVKFEICGVGCGGSATVPDDKKKPGDDTPTDPTDDPEPEPVCTPAENAAGTVAISASDSIKDPCKGFQYTLDWTFNDAVPPVEGRQKSFEIQIREYKVDAAGRQITTVPVYTLKRNISTTQYTLLPTVLSSMGLKLDYGKVYEWRVRATYPDTVPGCDDLTSKWSVWTGSTAKSMKIQSHDYPDVKFTVKNEADTDCVTTGKCELQQKIIFKDDNSRVYPSTDTKHYEWYLDGSATPYCTEAECSVIYYPADEKDKTDHTVKLRIRDDSDGDCNLSKTFAFSSTKMTWDEIAPTR